MAYIVEQNTKDFERPKNGAFVGVVADVIDLGIVQGKNLAFAAKPKVMIMWVLNAKDSEGKYFTVSSIINSSTHEKSPMFGIVKGVLGHVPAPPFDLEQILGKSNELFVLNEAVGDKTYSNIKGIAPLPSGTAPFAIPSDFVRDKDKPKDQQIAFKMAANRARNQQAQPAQTQAPTSQPVQQTAPAASNAAVVVEDGEIQF